MHMVKSQEEQVALVMGREAFEAFLSGAAEMDKEFYQRKATENLPFLLAALDHFYGNYLGAASRATFAYDYRLRTLVPYLQQLETESNGKDRDIEGNPVLDRVDDGDDVINLDDVLSAKSSWRSARLEPISIPGRNHIIEACSPKYAKMAMGTGLEHVNALPCEITTKVLPDGSLVVSYLDPDFMLKSMFADISQEDKDKFGAIPGLIMTDLQNIVKAAIENSGYEIDGGTQISFDMLPPQE